MIKILNKTTRTVSISSWDRVAKAYDRVSRRSRAHQDKFSRIALLIDSNASMNLLDLGCGSGLLEAKLFSNGFTGNITAIDGSQEMIDLAQVACANYPITLIKHDLNLALPIPDSNFDCAATVNLLFLLDDHTAFLREVRRVLRAGAPFYLVIPKPEEGGVLVFLREHFRGLRLHEAFLEVARLILSLPAIMATSRFQRRLDHEHAQTGDRYLTLDRTKKILSASGFIIINISDIQAGQNWLIECTADQIIE